MKFQDLCFVGYMGSQTFNNKFAEAIFQTDGHSGDLPLMFASQEKSETSL